MTTLQQMFTAAGVALALATGASFALGGCAEENHKKTETTPPHEDAERAAGLPDAPSAVTAAADATGTGDANE